VSNLPCGATSSLHQCPAAFARKCAIDGEPPVAVRRNQAAMPMSAKSFPPMTAAEISVGHNEFRLEGTPKNEIGSHRAGRFVVRAGQMTPPRHEVGSVHGESTGLVVLWRSTPLGPRLQPGVQPARKCNRIVDHADDDLATAGSKASSVRRHISGPHRVGGDGGAVPRINREKPGPPHQHFFPSTPHPTVAGCLGAGCSAVPNSPTSARLIAAWRVAAVIFAPSKSVT